MADQPELGARIRALRVERGLRQAELADGKVSVAYVSMVESGKRTPTLEVLTHFAQRLGCSVVELQGGPSTDEQSGWRLSLDYAEMALHNGEPAEARTRADDVLAAATADDLHLTDAEVVGRARWVRARALESEGDLGGAAAALAQLQAAADATGGGDPVRAMQVAVVLARCLTQLGDAAGAYRVVAAARDAAAAGGLQGTDGFAELSSTLMVMHYLRNEIDAAGEVADELIPLVETGGTRRARAAAYWNAAGVAEARGDLAGAVTLSERAVALLSEDDDERMLARARTASAWFILRADASRADDVLQMLGKAREVFETTGSTSDLSYTHVESGQALLILGRPEEALVEADTAIALLGEGVHAEAPSAWLCRASALVALGRRDEARESAARAESYLREMPPQRFTVLGLRELGQIHEALGDAALALAVYREALDLSAATTTPPPQAPTEVGSSTAIRRSRQPGR